MASRDGDPGEGTPHRLLAAWIGLLLGGVVAAVIHLAGALCWDLRPPMAIVVGIDIGLGAIVGWLLPRPVRRIGGALLSLLP